MAGDVVISFGADDREAARVIANLQRQNENLAASVAKIRQESTKAVDEEAKKAKWLASVKEQSAKLEFQAKLSAIQAEKKAEQDKVNWLQRLRQSSAQLAQQINLKEVQDTKKAAEDEKKIATDKAAWLARLRMNSADLERKANQQRLKDVERVLKGNDSQVGQLAQMAAGYVTIQTVTGLITAELQDQLAVQKEIADLQKTTAQPQGNFLRNLGLASDEERKAAVAKIEAVSRATGVSQGTLYSAGSTALSAKGDLTNMQAFDAVQMAAQIAPDNPQEMASAAGGLLDLVGLTGTASSSHNAGFMLQMGAASRVKSLDQINQNLVPAAIGVKSFGGTAGEAASLTATYTQLMKDVTGAQSGTASISLAKQLAEFLPATSTYKTDASGQKKLDRRGTGLSETDERIRYMQQHPELLDQFMGQATFEQRAYSPTRDILTKGTTGASLFEQNIPGFSGDLAGQAGAFIRGMGSEPLQQQADLTRRGLNVAEGMKLGNTPSAAKDSIYSILEEYQKARGVGWSTRTDNAMVMRGRDLLHSISGGYLGQSAGQSAIGLVEREATSGFGGGGGGTISQARDTPELREMVRLLRSLDEKATGRAAVNVDAHTE